MSDSFRSCTCGGFVPARLTVCPHCESPLAPRSRGGRLVRMLATLIGGGGFAMTLMACYGVAPQHAMEPGPNPCASGGMDADGDGVCTPQDCNDSDVAVYPGAEDVDGDALDQNCDGVDGWADPATTPPEDPAVPAEPAPAEEAVPPT